MSRATIQTRASHLVMLLFVLLGCNEDEPTQLPTDTVPPEAVADLSYAQTKPGAITLLWSTPGDDGRNGRASFYDLRSSPNPLTETEWDAAVRLDSLRNPLEPGMPDSFDIRLSAESPTYFGIRTADEVPNWSELSNILFVDLGDTTAPGPIVDLAATVAGATEVNLTWTAPGDDGSGGVAQAYDLRFALEAITEVSWPSATIITGITQPGAAGSREDITISLPSGRIYYLALRAIDESGNESALSNVANADLSIDGIPPGAVTDLASNFATGHSVSLHWTSPGDDDLEGSAARYDLRYSLSPLNEESWDVATRVETALVPAPAGGTDRIAVEGLELEATYYFALKAVDESENSSSLSNVATATTVALQQFTDERGLFSFAANPAWSPDGRTLAFQATWATGIAEIYVMPAVGGDYQRLTGDGGLDPSWSPDGFTLAFESRGSGGPYKIFGVDLPRIGSSYSSSPYVLVSDDAGRNVGAPAWSPDGTRIAYSLQTSASPLHFSVYVISSSGGAPEALVDHPSVNTAPAWSPDGSKIAFVSTRSGNSDIWVIPSTGGVPVQLTTDVGFDYGPTWSPDGERIAFFSDRSGDRDIWSISAAGGDASRMTSDTFDELSPAWSPDGTAIAFASRNPGPGTNLWVKYLR